MPCSSGVPRQPAPTLPLDLGTSPPAMMIGRVRWGAMGEERSAPRRLDVAHSARDNLREEVRTGRPSRQRACLARELFPARFHTYEVPIPCAIRPGARLRARIVPVGPP